MQKKILAQLLQFLIHIETLLEISALPYDNHFVSTRLAIFSDEYNFVHRSKTSESLTSSDSSSGSSESYSARRKKRHRRKCKCSCSECLNPKKCCIEMCNSCMVTPPNVMVAMPYPVPVIVPTSSTCKSSTKSRTTTKPSTKSRTTTKPETITSESTTTEPSTITTEPSTITTEPSTTTTEPSTTTTEKTTTEPTTFSTIPPSFDKSECHPSTINGAQCPGVRCIPKSWLKAQNGYPYRRNLKEDSTIAALEKKLPKVIPRRIVEIPPEFADSFLKQIQKVNEIPEDERSIDVQEIEVASSIYPIEETTNKEDNFSEEDNKYQMMNNGRNVKKEERDTKFHRSLESLSRSGSQEDRRVRHYTKRKYIMRVSQNELYTHNKRDSAIDGNLKVVNRRRFNYQRTSYLNVRTFRTLPIQKTTSTLKETDYESENKVNVFVLNVNRKALT